MNKLKSGDQIKIKSNTLLGWKGQGTVVRQIGDLVQFRKNDADPDDWIAEHCYAMRHEVSKTKK